MNDTLATGFDLYSQPAPYATTPDRLMDTRVAGYRSKILGASTKSPFDSSGRLKAGSWIDIGIDTLEEAGAMSAVFLNLTAVKPTSGGYLAAYPSGVSRPTTSNVNFQPKVTVANAAFIGVGVVGDHYAVRVYVSSASDVIVDLTGIVYGGSPVDSKAIVAKSGRTIAQARRLSRMRRAAGRSTR